MNTEGRVTVSGANWLFLIVLILQFAITFIVSIAELFYFAITQRNPQETTLMNIILIMTQIFAVFLPAITYLKLKRVNIKDTLRLKSLKTFEIALIIIMGITGQFIAQMLNIPVLYILDLLGEIPPSPISVPHTFDALIISLLIVAVVPAICEEIMMRGIIMRAYEIRGTRTGLIISSLFFGFIHGDIKNFFGPLFFGLVFGYLVMRTGSLLAGIIAHFSNNVFAMLLAYLQENHLQQIPFLQSSYFLFIAFFMSVIIFILAFILFNHITDWKVKSPVSTVTKDLKAAFLNIPIFITMVIYTFIQIIAIMDIVKGNV